MNSSTGIDLTIARGVLITAIVTPLMLGVMWFSTAMQLNEVQDKLDTIEAREQQIPTACTQDTTSFLMFKNTKYTCTGDPHVARP